MKEMDVAGPPEKSACTHVRPIYRRTNTSSELQPMLGLTTRRIAQLLNLGMRVKETGCTAHTLASLKRMVRVLRASWVGLLVG